MARNRSLAAIAVESPMTAATAALAGNQVVVRNPSAPLNLRTEMVQFDVLMGALARLQATFISTDPLFGGKSDGVTDDTAAITATCNAVPTTGGFVVVPPNTVWNASAVSPKANTILLDLSSIGDASSYTQSAILRGHEGEILRVMLQGGHAGGLRRDAGTPLQGGRVYIFDDLWTEDPAWFDEDVQFTSGASLVSTTLSATPAIQAKTITVVSAAGLTNDLTLHLENNAGQIDRPRITNIVGTTITLDSGLQYAHTSGDAVTTNPWRGAIFPINGWNNPGGSMNLGVDRGAAKAVTNPQSFSLATAYVRFNHPIQQWFQNTVLGGTVAATSGMVLSVTSGTLINQGWATAFGAQTVTITTADPSNPRLDIVVCDMNGAASVVAGTPAGSPVAPTPTASQTLLATIAVGAGVTSIVGGNITDSRAKYLWLTPLDPANGGIRLGPDINNFLRLRGGGSQTIVEAIRGGNVASLDLCPSGGGAALGGGTVTTKIYHGQTTLVGGTKVVNTAPATNVTANTKIFVTVHTPGGTPGWLQVSARTPATSFTILSSSGTDTSVVDYLMIEP